MPLPFPTDETLPLRLRPALAGKPFKGSIRLHTNFAGNFVQITLDTGATGETDVTAQYVSNDDDRGDIGPFSVTVSDGTTASAWHFGGMAVIQSRSVLPGIVDLWVQSDSLTVAAVPFKVGGIPLPVKKATNLRFVVKRAGITIGTLTAVTTPVLNIVFFFPASGGGRIAVKAGGNDIDWVHDGRKYTGFRFLNGVDGANPIHHYSGTSQTLEDLGIESVDDWEATLISAFTARNISLDAVELATAFPTQTFRMLIAPPSSFSLGIDYAGSIRLGFVNGVPSVTIQSGSNAPKTVPVTYDSSQAGYGVINAFSMDIGGVSWKFGQITVFRSVNKNYLASYQLTIDGGPFSMTGLPLPVKQPHFRPYPVFQNHVKIGTLTIISDLKGKFRSIAPGPQDDDVEILEEYLVWKHGNEEFFGFLFIVGLRYTPQTVIPDFGYLGGSVSTILNVNDWEATLIP